MSEIHERFLPRFIELANERVRRVLAALTDPAIVYREMHSLAGEAGMLGLSDVSGIAVEIATNARSWTGRPTSEQQLSCARLVRSLRTRVEQLKQAQHRPPAALVIDDSELVAEELAYGLRGAGFEAAIASTLEAAVAAAKARGPRVILVDANMPGIDLAELFTRVREQATGAKLVIVSGASENELASVARSVSADGYVSKLLGVTHVVDRILALLRDGGA